MSAGRIISWVLVGIFFLFPVNWIRLWITGAVPRDATLGEFIFATSVLWGISAALGLFLIVSAKSIRLEKAKDAKYLQEFAERPLSEIKPSQALLKSSEKAYGAIYATLKEIQTVGFSAGTTGASVRVAKGLTFRTSGTRGHAVKGLVTVASGELVVTDQRIIFAGDNKSFTIPLERLLNVTTYTDGFGFHDSKLRRLSRT